MDVVTSSSRQPAPPQFCNLDRLLYGLEQRGLDGIVATSAPNVYYLSGFAGIAHKSDEPRPYAVVISRHAPNNPILVLADYYLSTMLAQPSWIEDVRSFRAVMMPLDLAPTPTDVHRFIPQGHEDWGNKLAATHAASLNAACERALGDLALDRGAVAFDDLRFGHGLDLSHMSIRDGYDPMMYARSVKTPYEIGKLKAATRLNETAILDTIKCWREGMGWRDFNLNYQVAVAKLGGFVRDPGGMVWGHPRGVDDAITLESGFDDSEIRAGTNVMFDCHGTLDQYCWDGGKTWTVGADQNSSQRRFATAVANAAEAVMSAMKPGVRISDLQRAGRESFRQSGVPDADTALIFFHGLGLSHMDIEQTLADGSANGDWMLEKDMVVPLHVLYPGDEMHRCWVEEIAHVSEEGGRPFFSWGFEPLTDI